jgi:hypothetical protein
MEGLSARVIRSAILGVVLSFAVAAASCSTLNSVLQGLEPSEQEKTGKRVPLPPTIRDFEDQRIEPAP